MAETSPVSGFDASVRRATGSRTGPENPATTLSLRRSQSEGKTLIDLPYTERWKVLSALFRRLPSSTDQITRDPQVAEEIHAVGPGKKS